MYFELFQKQGDTFQRFLFNVREDYCKHIHGQMEGTLLKSVFPHSVDFANMNNIACPVKKDIVLTFENETAIYEDAHGIPGDYLGKMSLEMQVENDFLRVGTVEFYVTKTK